MLGDKLDGKGRLILALQVYNYHFVMKQFVYRKSIYMSIGKIR